ncbi:MAG: hypothetical protein ACOC8E_07275, partial [Planctomycetota bacterium]
SGRYRSRNRPGRSRPTDQSTAGDRDIPAVLPADTIAYVRLKNVPRLYKSFDRSGLKQAFLMGAQNEPELVAQVKAWDKIASQVRTLHVSYRHAHE